MPRCAFRLMTLLSVFVLLPCITPYGRVLRAQGNSSQNASDKIVQVEDAFNNFTRANGMGGFGQIQVQQPDRLHYLMQRYATNNARKPGYDGYRVLVYRGLGTKARQQANVVHGKVMERWPGIPAYVSYTAPYYRVCVGDCRTRQEALAWRNHLLAFYPQCFVVSEWINFPSVTITQIFGTPENNAQ